MSFKCTQMNIFMLPTKYDIINEINFEKKTKSKGNARDFIYIKKIALKIINIWDSASIPHYDLHQIITKIKLIYNKYKLYNKDKNKLRLKKLYNEFDTLFNIYKKDVEISKEDHAFLYDQIDKRRLMIGNLTCSKGCNNLHSLV